MSTLYIRLPSKAVADNLQPGMPLYCPFASVSNAQAVEREGVAALSDLSELVSRAQRVVLVLAASDVTLLRLKVPPMSLAKLKAALPHLVEDHLMSDPAECVVVAGDLVEDLRTVAVVQRDWLEILSKTLLSMGARNLVAVPSQLCVPYQHASVSAAVVEQGNELEVVVRLGEREGMGLPILVEQPEAVAFEVIQALCAVVPQAPIALYVSQSRVREYQDALRLMPGLDSRIELFADNWLRWISGSEKSPLNLMTGLGAAASPKLDWRPWRWPLALAALVLLVNAIGLNVEWLRLKREEETLRTVMVQTYKNTFPKENVIIDPLAQMRQKVAANQRGVGQLAPDDFLALTAAFSEAVRNAGTAIPPIAGVEYRERSLLVKLKPGNAVTIEQISHALAARNLSVSQASAGAWQIRSAK